MLTKRQQRVLMTFQRVGSDSDSLLGAAFRSTAPGKVWHIPCTQTEWDADQLPTTTERAVRTMLDYGLIGFEYKTDDHYAHLTPTGQRLATILAELPAPLTRRQWQILLRFRDVGSDSSSKYKSTFRAGNGVWQLPCTESEWRTWSQSLPGTNERTMRTLCDCGLIGFEYIPFNSTPYAHITPLGEELVSLLP